MKIVQVNTFDIHGGAARANFRLHRGLRSLGADTSMLCREKGSHDDRIFQVRAKHDPEAWDRALEEYRAVQQGYINRSRTSISNTVFSWPYHPGFDISRHPLVQEADVLNLHWVAEFLSPPVLNSIIALGKPVVWTLHDMWPFTGGCHYSAGCENYTAQCSDCPLLAEDPCRMPHTLLKDKLAFRPSGNLTIVSPSNRLREQAEESALFRGLRAETIPNGLDADIFAPIPKAEAKAGLGIPADTVTLGFGTGNAGEIRKGFKKLAEALYFSRANERFSAMSKGGEIRLVCFGEESPLLDELGIEAVSAGQVDSDLQLAKLYSAMDLFILPSMEDNLPNTMIEAMSCGTPVAGFRTGGVPDTVMPGFNGTLSERGDAMDLGQAVVRTVFDPDAMRTMGENARGTVLEKHTIQIQARRFLDLYEELCAENMPAAVPRYTGIEPVPADLSRLPGVEAIHAEILTHAQNALNARRESAL